ncbi:MAG: hypothetical protein AAFX55_21160 [Bacteroidota bacterium]
MKINLAAILAIVAFIYACSGQDSQEGGDHSSAEQEYVTCDSSFVRAWNKAVTDELDDKIEYLNETEEVGKSSLFGLSVLLDLYSNYQYNRNFIFGLPPHCGANDFYKLSEKKFNYLADNYILIDSRTGHNPFVYSSHVFLETSEGFTHYFFDGTSWNDQIDYYKPQLRDSLKQYFKENLVLNPTYNYTLITFVEGGKVSANIMLPSVNQQFMDMAALSENRIITDL